MRSSRDRNAPTSQPTKCRNEIMGLTLPEFPCRAPKRRHSIPVSLVSDAVKDFHQSLELLTCKDPHLRTTRRPVFQSAAWQVNRQGRYPEQTEPMLDNLRSD